MKNGKVVAGLIVWILIAFLPGIVGSLFTPDTAGDSWYSQLAKPAWNPPGWVFGPVWTTLYLLMGVAAWLVWKEGGFGAHRAALSIFLAQLVVNGLWSWFFFGLHLPLLALLDILLLEVLIVFMLFYFWRIQRWAAILILPYLAWVTYAITLNAGIVWMN